MKYLGTMAALMVLAAQEAPAQERVEMAPLSAWVLDYDDDSCALKRQFGDGDREVYLELRQFGPSREIQVIVGTPDFERRLGQFKVASEPVDGEAVTIDNGFQMTFGSGYEGKLFNFELGQGSIERRQAARAFAAETVALTEEQRALVLRFLNLDPESTERSRLAADERYRTSSRRFSHAFAQSDAWKGVRERLERDMQGLYLDGAFAEPIYLKTGEMHEPMTAMRACLDELMLHWGIDADAHRNLRQPVESLNRDHWARRMQEQYPAEMLRRGMQGLLRVRLAVSAEGKPTACHMQSPINHEEFEETACRTLMRTARFSPAIDADGQPIASFYQTSIVYALGG